MTRSSGWNGPGSTKVCVPVGDVVTSSFPSPKYQWYVAPGLVAVPPDAAKVTGKGGAGDVGFWLPSGGDFCGGCDSRTGALHATHPLVGKNRPMDERTALIEVLAAQRAHVLGILDGLSGDDLLRPVLPSGWSCAGLVHHLAVDVERFWFRAVVAGERVELLDGAAGWQVPVGWSADAVLELYREEGALADAVIGARPLDAAPAWWPTEVFPGLPEKDLRRTVLHVIAETACHAGHLDAARELLDGRRWLVLTDDAGNGPARTR